MLKTKAPMNLHEDYVLRKRSRRRSNRRWLDGTNSTWWSRKP